MLWQLYVSDGCRSKRDSITSVKAKTYGNEYIQVGIMLYKLIVCKQTYDYGAFNFIFVTVSYCRVYFDDYCRYSGRPNKHDKKESYYITISIKA